MNIVINAVISYEQPRGVGRYINDLLPVIAECDQENEYFIYYGKWMTQYSFTNVKQKNFHFIELDIKNNQITRNFYLAVVLPLICKKYKPDVFFLIDTQAILIKPSFMVSTIHDIAEYQATKKYSWKQALVRKGIVKIQSRLSNQIITDSIYSKNGICQILKVDEKKVNVIYLGTNMKSVYDNVEPDCYFLFVSETERAKNLIELIEAFHSLPMPYKEQYRIKVVGKKGNDYENIMQKTDEYQLKDRIDFFGYVSDEELEDLYKKAYAFVFPSFFEGFGLPVLEAMAKGTPVLCSKSSSIPEVGGDAVLTFDPYKPEELCHQMIRIIEDKNLRKNMIELGYKQVNKFSYKKTAIKTLEVFNKV